MPTVLREREYRFFFYADDRSEPRHVHVQREARSAKFWLEIEDTNFTNSHEIAGQREEVCKSLRSYESGLNKTVAIGKRRRRGRM
jgi:hypothetical protein